MKARKIMYKNKQSDVRLLFYGFLAIFMVVVALSFGALFYISSLNDRTQDIVENNNVKTTLSITMRDSIRKRQISIRSIFLNEDIFLREQERLHFFEHGVEFIEAREQLDKMQLTPAEKIIFDQVIEATKLAYPMQNKLVDIALEDVSKDEINEIIQKAFLAQSEVMSHLNEMVDLQRKTTEEILNENRDTYQQAMLLLSFTTAIGAAIILVIGVYVFRHTKMQMAEMRDLALFPYEDPFPVMRISEKGVLLYANPASEIFLKDWSIEVGETIPRDWYRIITSSSSNEYEVELGGTIFLMYISFVKEGNYYNLYGNDITDRENLKRELAYQASHDPLTDLLNRREFEEQLALARQSAIEKSQMHSLLYIDLDQFKVVNDTCGHIAGDSLLKEVSKALIRRTRSVDTVARLGGDEFGIILNCCNFDNAIQIAETIKDQISKLNFQWEDKRFDIGASIGVVPISATSELITELLAAADSACYLAKERGRNRIHATMAGDISVAKHRGQMNWISKINHAIESNNFCLFGQSIVSINNNKKVKYKEVLVRLIDQGQIVTPNHFIPAAERYNVMPLIDKWVINTFFENILLPTLNSDEEEIGYAINLSGQSLNDQNLTSFVIEYFKQHPEVARRVCFEITETAAISNLRVATRFISKTKSLGCKFALDDFGNGLSSFSYLKNIDVDFIKIDGMFVKEAFKNRLDRAMIEAISNVGHEMGIEIIAEFVENTETIECLKEIGVDYIQGYVIDRPALLYSKQLAKVENNI